MKKYQKVPLPECLQNLFQIGTKCYISDVLKIFVSPPFDNLGWHMSISCKSRNPTWEEIRDAWYDLVPDAKNRNGAMFFPPEEEYVNLHNYCFHIHEVHIDAKNFNFKNAEFAKKA